jgi:hypothetical protein
MRNLDPNQHRQRKAALLAEAQAYRDNAEADGRDLTGPERRAEERLLGRAHQHEQEAQAIEAEEAAAAVKRKAK